MNYSEVKKELKKEYEDFLKPIGYKSKSGSQGCEFRFSCSVENLLWSFKLPITI